MADREPRHSWLQKVLQLGFESNGTELVTVSKIMMMSFDKKFWSRQWELWNHELDRNENFRYWLPCLFTYSLIRCEFSHKFLSLTIQVDHDKLKTRWQVNCPVKKHVVGTVRTLTTPNANISIRYANTMVMFKEKSNYRTRGATFLQRLLWNCTSWRVFLFCSEFSDQVAMICGNFNRGLHYGRRNVDCNVVRTWKVEILIARIQIGTVSVTFCHDGNNCDTFSMQTGF